MKKIKFILFATICCIFYLLSKPIYLQYEVNKQFSDYEMYQIDNFKGSTVKKSFNILNDEDIFYINRPENESNFELNQINYYFGGFNDNNITLGSKLKLENKTATEDSFAVSSGYIFSKNSSFLSKMQNEGIAVKKIENFYNNSLSRFILENTFVLLSILLFSFLLNMTIATSYIKEYALRVLNGQEIKRVFGIFIKSYLKKLIAAISVFFLIYASYQIVVEKYQITLNYIIFYLITNALIILLLVGSYCTSLFLLKSVNIVGVLKNNLYSSYLYYIFICSQAALLIFFPIVLIASHNTYAEYNKAVKEVKGIEYLSKYQTFYGTNSIVYDSLDSDNLSLFENRFKELYMKLNTENKLHYFSPDYLNYQGSAYELEISSNLLYMNLKYYKEIAKFNREVPILSKDKVNILVPEKEASRIDELFERIPLKKEESNILVVPDDLEISFSDYSMAEEINSYKKVAKDKVIIVADIDKISYASPNKQTYFMSIFTSGNLFTEMNFSEMMRETKDYKLDELVTPASKLSPYEESIENIEYYYNLTLYTFLLSLVAVVVMTIVSLEIILSMKKFEIIVEFLHGYFGLSKLRLPIYMYGISSVLGLGIVLWKSSSTTTIIIYLAILICIVMYSIIKYYKFLRSQVHYILKGE